MRAALLVAILAGATGIPVVAPEGTALAALIVGEGRLRDVDLYNAVVIHADSETEAAGVDDLMQAFDWLADEGVRIVCEKCLPRPTWDDHCDQSR